MVDSPFLKPKSTHDTIESSFLLLRIYVPNSLGATVSVTGENNQQKISVLIVDDEPDLRDIYAYKLEIEGYKVCTADGGHEAIEMLKKEDNGIDLVLTDLMMPKGNGIELAEFSLNLNVPILIASAYIDSFKGKIPEGAMILRKPFNLDELTICIQKAVKKNET